MHCLFPLLNTFKVAILSSFDRRIASWLYGEVPKGTVAEAIEMFLKFERESPIQLKDCRLHLAKCYIAKAEYDTAVEWIEQALQLPAKDSEVSITILHNKHFINSFHPCKMTKAIILG